MEEKEIDLIIADSLDTGDLIRVNGKIEEVDYVDSLVDDDEMVHVYTVESGRDEPIPFKWDQKVTLYSY